MLCFVLNIEDVVKDDIVYKDSSKDPHNYEDAGLGEYFCQERKMMEDDLEHHSRDDETCEHDGAGELCPPPGCQVNATMVTFFPMTSVIKFLMAVTRSPVTIAGVCLSILETKCFIWLIRKK